ncbi:hypothetical protein ACMAUO_00300 [Gluconacetobacter sp. Hr-1-5]|uniref:hypothetical protein n=1 Tax=Gluconacetobacter sp. Hr-1-5 TaxID=3395370 RepID=UPI003B51EFD6
MRILKRTIEKTLILGLMFLTAAASPEESGRRAVVLNAKVKALDRFCLDLKIPRRMLLFVAYND